jgi:hypothetical protein
MKPKRPCTFQKKIADSRTGTTVSRPVQTDVLVYTVKHGKLCIMFYVYGQRRKKGELSVLLESVRGITAAPNVMIEWLALLLCIREVPGSYLGPDTGNPN